MHKITYDVDAENRRQYSVEFQGRRYGVLYPSEAAAQHVVEDLRYEVDEDGYAYPSPIDYLVEKADPEDFKKRRQCIAVVCRHCGSKINSSLLPIPFLTDLSHLSREWVIDADDFAHDPGCESIIMRALLLMPLSSDESE